MTKRTPRGEKLSSLAAGPQPTHTAPSDFDLLFEAYSWRNRDEPATTMDMGLLRHDHQNVWSNLSRAQLAFINDRLADYLDDTSRDQNWVYVMKCGHELDSPYRLTRNSRAQCSVHGFQRLVSGGLMADDFLPTYKEWLEQRKAELGDS